MLLGLMRRVAASELGPQIRASDSSSWSRESPQYLLSSLLKIEFPTSELDHCPCTPAILGRVGLSKRINTHSQELLVIPEFNDARVLGFLLTDCPLYLSPAPSYQEAGSSAAGHGWRGVGGGRGDGHRKPRAPQ